MKLALANDPEVDEVYNPPVGGVQGNIGSPDRTKVDSEVDDPPVEGGVVDKVGTVPAARPMAARANLEERAAVIEIVPVTHDLGDFKVRRALPAKTRTMVGPFIFVDQFGPARLPAGQGMDVRPHPHINLATVTYLFDGAIRHRDSVGSDQVIRPGAINLMTAGSGIVHSERSPDAERADGPSFYGMQTWLALPDGKEEIAPAFEHVGPDALPVVEGDGLTARVLMGTLWGQTSPVTHDLGDFKVPAVLKTVSYP